MVTQMFEYTLLHLTILILRLCTDGRKGVLEQARGAEQPNITEATPNELQLGEGG